MNAVEGVRLYDSTIWQQSKDIELRPYRYSKKLNVRCGLIQPIFLFEFSGKVGLRQVLKVLVGEGVLVLATRGISNGRFQISDI